MADSTGIKGDSVGFSGVLGVGPVVTAGELRSVFRGRPGGVAVVTADAGDGPVGLTATCVVPVSASTAMLAFSVSEFLSGGATIRRAETVVVHLLSAAEEHFAKLWRAVGAILRV